MKTERFHHSSTIEQDALLYGQNENGGLGCLISFTDTQYHFRISTHENLASA